MKKRTLLITRRHLLCGIGGIASAPLLARIASAQEPPSVVFHAQASTLVIRPGAATPVWQLLATSPAMTAQSVKFGDEIEALFENQLPSAAHLRLCGLDGALPASPASVRAVVGQGARSPLRLKFNQAGTFVASVSVPGDGPRLPSRSVPLVVREAGTPVADRDEVLMLEDWRLRPDNTAMPAGAPAGDATSLWTVNGKESLDIAATPHQRLRFRFINSSQRSVIAIIVKEIDLWVLAIDSQPAEPFLARNGQIVLAPGTRIDAIVDAPKNAGAMSEILIHDGKSPRVIAKIATSGTPARDQQLAPPRPLPQNGLPQKIDLKNALRADIALGLTDNAKPDWSASAELAAKQPPAFRARVGRPVVLALTNRGTTPTVFHLQGHHFRLLDRLDDGWKPFWLDTLMIDKGQTQRVAFVAEYNGPWLLEATGMDWAAPRLTRWYAVE